MEQNCLISTTLPFFVHHNSKWDLQTSTPKINVTSDNCLNNIMLVTARLCVCHEMILSGSYSNNPITVSTMSQNKQVEQADKTAKLHTWGHRHEHLCTHTYTNTQSLTNTHTHTHSITHKHTHQAYKLTKVSS